MSYDNLLKLCRKYAQIITQNGPSVFDLFRQLPPPAVPLEDDDGGFTVNVSVMPGPRIVFNIVSQRLESLKSDNPQNQQEIARMQKVLAKVRQYFVQHYLRNMLSTIKKNVSPEDYKLIATSGVPGEYTVWTL